MADRDHIVGIRAGMPLWNSNLPDEEHGTRPPPTKNSDGSIEINLTGDLTRANNCGGDRGRLSGRLAT